MMGGDTGHHLQTIVNSFNSIIPQNLIQDFTPEELEMMICGRGIINIDDWKANTEYSGGYTPESQIVIWFWEIVEEMIEV
jgi:hypothetical protein